MLFGAIAVASASFLSPAASALVPGPHRHRTIHSSRATRPLLCSDNSAATDWDDAWRDLAAKRKEAEQAELTQAAESPISVDDDASVFRFTTEEDRCAAAAKETERQLHLRQRYDFFQGMQRLTAFALSATVLTWVLLLLVYLPGSALYSSVNGLPGLGSMDKATFARSVLLPGGEACAAVAIVSVLTYSSVAGSVTAVASMWRGRPPADGPTADETATRTTSGGGKARRRGSPPTMRAVSRSNVRMMLDEDEADAELATMRDPSWRAQEDDGLDSPMDGLLGVAYWFAGVPLGPEIALLGIAVSLLAIALLVAPIVNRL